MTAQLRLTCNHKGGCPNLFVANADDFRGTAPIRLTAQSRGWTTALPPQSDRANLEDFCADHTPKEPRP